MKLLKEQVMWDYYSKFDPILDKYVPDKGEGETIASQIVTAVNKLVYKWYNDGDVYDNTKYLKGWANDLSSYANWLYKHLGSVLKGTLSRIFVDETEDDYEETLKELADKTLDETFLSKFEKQPKLGSIYECDGPFKFIDREDEEDEEELDENCKSKKMSKRVLKEKAWEKEVPADIATTFRKAINDDGAQMKNIIAGVTPLLDWIAEECPDCESDVDTIRDDLQVIDPEASSTDLFADDVDDGTNEEYFNDCILNPIYDLCDELNIWIPTEAMMEKMDSKKLYSVYKVTTDREFVDDDLKEDELSLKLETDSFEEALDKLEDLELEGHLGVIKDNEVDEFVTEQEIDNWKLAKQHGVEDNDTMEQDDYKYEVKCFSQDSNVSSFYTNYLNEVKDEIKEAKTDTNIDNIKVYIKKGTLMYSSTKENNKWKIITNNLHDINESLVESRDDDFEKLKLKKVFDVAVYDNQNNLVDYYTIEADNDGEAEKEALDLAWEASNEWNEIDHMSNAELADFDIEEAKEAWKDMHYAAVVGANVMKEALKDSTSVESKATELVKDYYNHEFDLPTLHKKLKDLFGSTKEAVIWFAENDEKIKNKNLNESTWGQIIKPMGSSASKKLEFINKQNPELFDELNEEVEDITNGIVEYIFVDEYRLNKSEILGKNITEEEYKNAVKQMYKLIDKYYRKCNGNDKLAEDYSGKQPDANTSLRDAVAFIDPKEFQLDQVRADITLQDAWDKLQKGENIYRFASVDGKGFDSDVREKIFIALANALDLNYKYIYSIWFNNTQQEQQDNKDITEDKDRGYVYFLITLKDKDGKEYYEQESISEDIFSNIQSSEEGPSLKEYFQEYYDDEVIKVEQNGYLKEDTIKQGNVWVNKGKEGTHGKFKTKKEADDQRKAMFAQGYKAEGLDEDILLDDDQELEDDLSDDDIKELECFAANVIKEKGQPVSENISGNTAITVDDDEPVVDYVNENISQAKEK